MEMILSVLFVMVNICFGVVRSELLIKVDIPLSVSNGSSLFCGYFVWSYRVFLEVIWL